MPLSVVTITIVTISLTISEAPFVHSLLSVYFSKFTPRCLVGMHPESEQLLNLVYCFIALQVKVIMKYRKRRKFGGTKVWRIWRVVIFRQTLFANI